MNRARLVQLMKDRRAAVRGRIESGGPQHAADLWRELGIPRGSIYAVLRCRLFRQLDDARWALAAGNGET